MGNSKWEREWNGLHNWESRAHRLHEVIGTQQKSRYRNKFKTEWSAELTIRVSYTDIFFHSLCNFVA